MKKIDLSDFYKETDTSETRAYEHALDIEFIVHREMQRQGLTKSDLAERMNISLPALSKLLNSQPNMTLKTIARFELALGIEIAPHAVMSYSNECPYTSPVRNSNNPWGTFGGINQERPAGYSVVKGGLAA